MSRTEQHICSSFASLLDRLADGAAIPDESDEHRDMLDLLERFLPAILQRVYTYWRGATMDGFLLPVARKTGPREAEFIGLAILIQPDLVTPVHIRLQVCAEKEEIVWLECRVGEPGKGKGGMTEIRYGSSRADKWLKQLLVEPKAPEIDWVFKIQYGERPSQKLG